MQWNPYIPNSLPIDIFQVTRSEYQLSGSNVILCEWLWAWHGHCNNMAFSSELVTGERKRLSFILWTGRTWLSGSCKANHSIRTWRHFLRKLESVLNQARFYQALSFRHMNTTLLASIVQWMTNDCLGVMFYAWLADLYMSHATLTLLRVPRVNFDPRGAKRVISFYNRLNIFLDSTASAGLKNDPRTHVGVKFFFFTWL